MFSVPSRRDWDVSNHQTDAPDRSIFHVNLMTFVTVSSCALTAGIQNDINHIITNENNFRSNNLTGGPSYPMVCHWGLEYPSVRMPNSFNWWTKSCRLSLLKEHFSKVIS